MFIGSLLEFFVWNYILVDILWFVSYMMTSFVGRRGEKLAKEAIRMWKVKFRD